MNNSLDTYRRQVAQFIDVRGGVIHAAERERHLTLWDFNLNMLDERAKEAAASATNKYFEMGRDIQAYAELCELTVSEYFKSLEIVSQRALERLMVFFVSIMPFANSDSSDIQLQADLDARKNELSCLRNTVNHADLRAGTAGGVYKPFADLLLELVGKRNDLARARGHRDYYRMAVGSYDEMRHQLEELKPGLDSVYAQLNALPGDEPDRESCSLTRLPGERKVPKSVALRTGQLLGLSSASLERILAASDTHPRLNKNKNSFLCCVDSPVEVRAHLNIPENSEEITEGHIRSLVHEVIGHAIDYASIRSDLPAVLRGQWSFPTEVLAMLAESLLFEPRWLESVGGLDARAAKLLQRQRQTGELRSTLDMMRYQIAVVEFEALMYEDPTRDLDALFYELMCWYHGRTLKEDSYPKGHWALHIAHYVEAPCYCHNYVLGVAWALQIRQAFRRKFGSFASRRVGPYLAKRRCDGLLGTPDEQLMQITGEPFSSKAVVKVLTHLLESVQKGGQTKELVAI